MVCIFTLFIHLVLQIFFSCHNTIICQVCYDSKNKRDVSEIFRCLPCLFVCRFFSAGTISPIFIRSMKIQIKEESTHGLYIYLVYPLGFVDLFQLLQYFRPSDVFLKFESKKHQRMIQTLTLFIHLTFQILFSWYNISDFQSFYENSSQRSINSWFVYLPCLSIWLFRFGSAATILSTFCSSAFIRFKDRFYNEITYFER